MTPHFNTLSRILRAACHAAVATTIAIFTGAALAQSTAAVLVSPGLWEIAPQTTAGASVSYRLCFARGDLDDLKPLLPNLSNGADCPAQRIDAANGVMTWEFSCPAKSFRGEGRYQLSAAAIEGTINFTQGVPAVTTSQSIAAKHLGACPAR